MSGIDEAAEPHVTPTDRAAQPARHPRESKWFGAAASFWISFACLIALVSLAFRALEQRAVHSPNRCFEARPTENNWSITRTSQNVRSDGDNVLLVWINPRAVDLGWPVPTTRKLDHNMTIEPHDLKPVSPLPPADRARLRAALASTLASDASINPLWLQHFRASEGVTTTPLLSGHLAYAAVGTLFVSFITFGWRAARLGALAGPPKPH